MEKGALSEPWMATFAKQMRALNSQEKRRFYASELRVTE